MWSYYRKCSNKVTADAWRQLIEGFGVPIRLLPERARMGEGDLAPHHVLVPEGKEALIDEILRNL